MGRLVSCDGSSRHVVETSRRSVFGGDYCLLPRTEFETFVLEVPPLDARELDAAIPQRIRALYPGNRDSTLIDHRKNGNDDTSRIVFVASRTAVEEYRRRCGKSRLVAVSLLLSQGAPVPGPWTAVFWTRTWYERCSFSGRRLISTERRERSGDLRTDLSRDVLPLASACGPAFLILSAEAANDRGLVDSINECVGESLRVKTIESFIPRPDFGASELFPRGGKRVRNPGPTAIRALVLCDLFLVWFAFERYAAFKEARLAAVKDRYVEAREENGERAENLAELKRWEERLADLKAARGTDSYALIAELASGMGENVLIKSLTIQGADFSLEAEGDDALGALSRLERSGRFADVQLHHSIPMDGIRGERFSLSGRFNNDRP